MNFDPDPRWDATLAAAEGVCKQALPGLPAEGTGFFRDAYRAFECRRLFEEDSLEVAARIAAGLARTSGSLALAFAAGFGFARAQPPTGVAIGKAARANIVGVLAFGTPGMALS